MAKTVFQMQLAVRQADIAISKYHFCFNAPIYNGATKDKSYQYCNALLDEALAICGDPRYKVSNRKWSALAIRFLRLFA